MDQSNVVAFGTPAIGVIACVMWGVWLGRRAGAHRPGQAVLMALVFGVALTVVQLYAHDVCIDKLRKCMQRGEGNMSYWFQSFMAVPLFWAALLGAWRLTPQRRR